MTTEHDITVAMQNLSRASGLSLRLDKTTGLGIGGAAYEVVTANERILFRRIGRKALYESLTAALEVMYQHEWAHHRNA